MHEQQGFVAPLGLSQPALRNQAALDALVHHEMAQQERQSGALPATELVAAADELADLAPSVAKVDMLRHSHALYQQDFLASVNTLYKYFDHSTGELALPAHPHRQYDSHLFKFGTSLLITSLHVCSGHLSCLFWCHAGTQTPRPTVSTMGAEPNKGHFQDALLSLGTAHTHFGHVQVSSTSAVFIVTCITSDDCTTG